MFSSKSKESAQASASAPAGQMQQQKKALRSGSAPSIISADLIVNGTLTSTGDIQVDGRVEGDVHSAGLVIGDHAVIHGEVFAEEVTVRGRVEGSIRARKVLLCSTCHVEGNILHEAFAVETGAFFEGNCRHADNPLSEDVGPRKTSEMTSRSVPAPAPAPAPVNSTSSLGSASTPAMPAPAAVAAVARPNGEAAPRPVASNYAPLKTGA
jgi:cytoskeletal protein CcmA (bactofilin family)